MILFYNDWLKYPNAIMHTKTRNRSFYIMAIKYKLMGVKNHAFMLALFDPTLEDVDPFDEENLTDEQKDRIVVEVMRNPWYFFREILKLPASGGATTFLEANRANIPLFFFFFCHIFIILIQIRQTGKSATTDAIKAYALYFGTLRTCITFLTNSNRNRLESVERIRTYESLFPTYLKMISPDDINNQERIYLKSSTLNRYETAVAQAVEEAAKMVHRGNTSPLQHIDEFAYINNLKLSLSSMLSAGNAARDQAAEAGSLYGTILSTTAGYKDSDHGRYAYKVYSSGAIFTEKMFDCEDREELEKLIRKLSPTRESRILIEMNHRQLGKSDEWLVKKIEESASEGNQILTDYFNTWVTDKGKELISPDDIKKISDSKAHNYNPDISDIEGYMIRWFISDEEKEKLRNGREVITIGMDTSEALGNDDISLVMRRVTTGEVIAAGDFNETNTTIFGKYVAQLLLDFPTSLLVIERRSTGTSIIDSIIPILLQNNINPLLRMFNWAVNDMHLSSKNKDTFDELMKAYNRRDRTVFDRHKKLFGFSTSGGGRTSRTKLYSDTFNAAVKYTGSTVRDPKTIKQIIGLREINGRIDHGDDDHDDMVIAWLLSFWVLKSASNLKVYGVDTNSVLVNIKETIYTNGEKDIEKMKKLKKHNDAMSAMKKLSDILKESKNQIEIREAKMMMRRVSNHLDYTAIPSFNVDVYINRVEEEKRINDKINRVA